MTSPLNRVHVGPRTAWGLKPDTRVKKAKRDERLCTVDRALGESS